MQLLGIFDFYYFHELSMPLGTNWLEVIVTAGLAGIVAWGAAFVQITFPRYHSKKDSISEASDIYLMFKRNLESVANVTKEFNNYLIKSVETTSFDKAFEVPDQSINTTSFKVIENLSYKELHKSLLILKTGNDKKEMIFKSYSSSSALYDNYQHIRGYQNLKFEEYNKLVDRVNDVTELIAIKVQDLVFSQNHNMAAKHFQTIPIPERALFRKQNPQFELLQDLDKITGDFQQKKDAAWPNVEAYISELKGVVQKYSIQFPDIILAQNITKAIVLLENLKVFYSTFNSTYKSYYEVNKKYIDNIESVLHIDIDPPRINWFQNIY